jgi:hypothetical protein
MIPVFMTEFPPFVSVEQSVCLQQDALMRPTQFYHFNAGHPAACILFLEAFKTNAAERFPCH